MSTHSALIPAVDVDFETLRDLEISCFVARDGDVNEPQRRTIADGLPNVIPADSLEKS